MSSTSTDPTEEEQPTGAKLESSALRPPPIRSILKKPSVHFDANEGTNQSSR
jgi:hypothetical protein